MRKIVISSTREDAGKTSVIVGLAKVLNKKTGYMKPFGDRLLYRKKRLWDNDAALFTNIFGITDDPEDMSIGFDHSKLRYMYDEAATKQKLNEALAKIGNGKDLLFIEGGKDLFYGASIHLSALSVAKHLDAELVVVISGDHDSIMDEISFVKKYVNLAGIKLTGVIINKVQDIEEFKHAHISGLNELGVKVLGILPYQVELTHFSVNHLVDRLFAKVLAGESGLNNTVKHIFVGAMSANAALTHPQFENENKIIITAGDRSDMILAALETDTAGIILTNNVLPPSNIISKAAEHNLPLLLVRADTWETVKQIDHMRPLLMKDETEKIKLLEKLAGNINV